MRYDPTMAAVEQPGFRGMRPDRNTTRFGLYAAIRSAMHEGSLPAYFVEQLLLL
jgi:hypothetical protein